MYLGKWNVGFRPFFIVQHRLLSWVPDRPENQDNIQIIFLGSQAESKKAEILEKYLPDQLSETEIKKELKSIISDIGASSMVDIGKVMGKAMASLKGKADGSLISKLVKELLS